MTTQLEQAARQALEALEKALRYHGVMLWSDPPKDAWKFHGVEQTAHKAITALRQALEQPAQDEPQPCPYVVSTREGTHHCSLSQREWVGLTDDEVAQLAVTEWEEAFARDIEAKLKEKNT